MSELGAQVNTFSYTREVLEELERSLSPERMGTYLVATHGNKEKAAQLYTWNTAISAAFYSLLQGLEVTLRNAIHVQLAGKYGLAWYDNRAAGLDKGALERIGTAKAHLKGKVYATEAPRIVASLSFGFWVAMLGSGGRIDDSGGKANYEMTLWRPALRKAFPHYKPLIRKQVHAPLSDLRTLRNRIAHHEPIFARQLRNDHERILEVTGWISPQTKAWMNHHSRVPGLLALPWDALDMRF